MVVEVAVIKDVCSSCSSKSACNGFSKRISSGRVVVKVTELLEQKLVVVVEVVKVDVVKVVLIVVITVEKVRVIKVVVVRVKK